MLNLIERLRTRKAFFINGSSWLMTNSLDADCAEAADEIERLRAALQWYADKENYATGQDCPDVLIDGGGLARHALEQSASDPYRAAVDEILGIKRT